MKYRWLTLISILLFSSTAVAYQLNGTMTDNGNGTYSVTLENEEGHEFNGTAKDQDDGSMVVTVQDASGVKYKGVATLNGDEEYDIELKDPATGNFATGTLDVD